MENQTLPQFYKKPVALSSEIHATTTITPRNGGFAFSEKGHSVVLAGVEFAAACHEFPIVFSTGNNGRIIPAVLLGVQMDENLYVDEEGEWHGSYIPAYIRRYPFINADSDDQRLIVCIDEAYDGFNGEGGQPLFENNAPSEYLKQVLALLEDYQAQMLTTEAFCQHLAQLDVLKPMDASIHLNDGRTFNINGLLVVDEEKLLQLDKDTIDQLFRSGGLALVYAHLLSLRNLNNLMEKKVRRN